MNSMDRQSNLWRNSATRNNIFLASGFFAMLFGYAYLKNRSTYFAEERDPLAPRVVARKRLVQKGPEFWLDEHRYNKNDLPW